MAAYDLLIHLIKEYFIDLGYNNLMVDNYFTSDNFKELISIRLANANIVIRNKTDRSSHQTHIAITGEAIDFFYKQVDFLEMDNKTIDKRLVYVSKCNLQRLANKDLIIPNTNEIELIKGYVTLGKRTQKQVQLSKKNSENSECFNNLRLGLYENDLLIMLKYRKEENILAIGIPTTFYLDCIPNYVNKYEANTYLRMSHL